MKKGRQLLAIEVKSGRKRETLPGLASFLKAQPTARPLLIGADTAYRSKTR